MRSIRLESPAAVVRFHDLPGADLPLLFLHGLGCASSSDYPRVARDPALRDRHLLLVDLLGSGFSDRPTDFAYSVEAHARVVAEVVHKLELPALDLYGHSMGGAVAIVAAELLGARARNLVLSEPNLDAGGGPFSRAIAAEPEEAYVRSGHRENVRREAEAGNVVWSGTLALTLPLAAHREATSLVRGGDRSWRETLSALRLRRTVLFGERSLPDADFTRLPGEGIRVAKIARAGHSMAWENPEGLARAIAAATAEAET